MLFELKNPYSDAPTVDEALNQIQHYIHDVPQLQKTVKRSLPTVFALLAYESRDE